MSNTMTTTSSVQAVIFDWAGTIVDFGSFAPTTIFVEAFKQGFDFDISLEESRVPMGVAKRDHIQRSVVCRRWKNVGWPSLAVP
ncbi:phosphonoacetaldehyde hydrolase [Photobacterium aphoticum]|uniref:Phosphonoacetaldehyde hydrolase n=1 Tax=Photobacterium aphoticum TaxID=754436 RepID=A0A090QSA9_9GAMM|nr:phosphonoacetaldehyde hydrolase [Photobacterium aphoticum]